MQTWFQTAHVGVVANPDTDGWNVGINNQEPVHVTRAEATGIADHWQRLGDLFLFARRRLGTGAATIGDPGTGFVALYDQTSILISRGPVTVHVTTQEFIDLGDFWRSLAS